MEFVFRLRRSLCFLAGKLRRGRRGVFVTGGRMGSFIVSTVIGGNHGAVVSAREGDSRGVSVDTVDGSGQTVEVGGKGGSFSG